MAKTLNAFPAGFESDEEEIDFLMGNLKIKRLEHITTGAGLDGRNFDATLDMECQQFFNTFRENWNMQTKNKSPYLRQDLRAALLRHENPLVLALMLFANCPDSSNVKNKSLSHFVLDTVCKLHAEVPHINENCDDNTSMIAFNFVKTTGLLSLNNAMISTYRLQQISALLLPKLRALLDEGYYKEVTQWAINLHLSHAFDMMELAFPLVAQEKLPLAEEYLDKATHQRLPFVQYLDSLLHKDKPVIELCESRLSNYKNLKVSHHVLTYRPISKIVGRLAKKYNFGDSITPNLKFTKTCGYLHHLYREYEKANIGLEAYRELVLENAYNHALKKDLVNYIAATQAHSEALYWYKKFKLKPCDCPNEIKSMISRNEIDEVQNDRGGDGDSPSDTYLTMDLPHESLIIVDDPIKFETMIFHLNRERIIYMDAEWKQNVCVDNQLCLMQIAAEEYVYLIDCLAPQPAENWRALGAIFNNVNIIKVGFSLHTDIMVLQQSLPLQLRLHTPNHYLDLRVLWQHLKRRPYGVDLPYGNTCRAGDALTDLTMLCFGKKLNKSNQCSNWANRPLRHEQILYAAMDARCLLLIYNTLLAHVPDINVALEKTMAGINFLKRGGNAK
ncbi:exonuclease mut-7 homolog [Scaptodrosophila lebanonensis]|uniref:Exonuclease mut-7 homolog n=1 Tax=Drosophila lebanonensis TaxID=7225 RepID=A0A6J2U5P7_DROLE|nr:exonuclease mut-7 homolog [Scaptodrosophila lebanonensis]